MTIGVATMSENNIYILLYLNYYYYEVGNNSLEINY